MTPGRRSCQALCRPAHATATTSDVRSSPVLLGPPPHHSAPTLCRTDPTPSAASSHETSPKYAWPAGSSPAEAHVACRRRRQDRSSPGSSASLARAIPHTSVVSAWYPAFAHNQSVCWRASWLLHLFHGYAYSCPQ